MSVNLNGNRAPSRPNRVVTTSGATIKFSTDLEIRDYEAVPGLLIEARHMKDPSPRTIRLTRRALEKIANLESFKKAVSTEFKANGDYFNAKDIDGNNESLGVASQRKQAFFDAVAESLDDTDLPRSDYRAAQKFLKQLEERSYMDRTITFDTSKLDTYHPYGHPFDEGVEKIAALAPEGFERDSITKELNYITDRKSKYGWGNVNERNAESTLQLRAIDRGNDNQAISLTKDSTNPRDPRYVVLNVNKAGLPEGMEEHAGKAVFRDGDKVYFDKTSTEVPAVLVDHLQEKRVSSELGLRTLESSENSRNNFPYDWNQNNSIDVDTINTGWWGHCHIEAPLAAWDLAAGSELVVFDARSKGFETFDDTQVNDLLFAMLDANSYKNTRGNRPVSVEETTFVGFRNDTTGGQLPSDRLILDVNGRERSFNINIKELFEVGNSEESVDSDKHFSPTLLKEGIRFEDNPAFTAWRDNDWTLINGERKLVATIKYMDVSSSGSVERVSKDITLDPNNPSDEPVLLGSQLGQGSYPPNVTRFYLNETDGTLESRRFRAEKKEDGTYEMVATSDEARLLGRVTNRTLTRELTKESILALHNHVLDSARRGVSFVTEKSAGYMVWNYGTDSMSLNKLEEDGDFVKYEITLKTQGGTRRWAYVLQYDQDGEVASAHAIGTPADFVWRTENALSVPVYKDDEDRILFNSDASDRGFLLDSDGRISSEGMSFFRYASDVVYASLADPSKEKRLVVIDEEGELYFYDDQDAYKKDLLSLGGNAEKIEEFFAPEPEVATEPAGPIGPVNLVDLVPMVPGETGTGDDVTNEHIEAHVNAEDPLLADSYPNEDVVNIDVDTTGPDFTSEPEGALETPAAPAPVVTPLVPEAPEAPVTHTVSTGTSVDF